MDSEILQLNMGSLTKISKSMDPNDKNIFSMFKFMVQNPGDYHEFRKIILDIFPKSTKQELMLKQIVLLISKELRPNTHAGLLFHGFNILISFLECLLISNDTESATYFQLLGQVTIMLDSIVHTSQTKSRPISKHAKTNLSNLLRRKGALEAVLKSIFDVKFAEKDNIRNSLLIGVCIDLAFATDKDVQEFKPAVVNFICKVMLPSKSIVSAHYLDAMGTSCGVFIDRETYAQEIVAQSDRLLLRSPEVALAGTNN